MKLTFELATAILIPLLVTAPVRGETQTSDYAAAPQLHISLLDRDSDSAPAGSESRQGFTIQVTDSSGAPAADSAVVFRLPDEGASGSFEDGAHSAIVYTSADGRAKISGIKWSDIDGPVAIKVTATKGDARAGFLLQQLLTPKATSVAVERPKEAAAPVAEALPKTELKSAASAPALQVLQPGAPLQRAPLPRVSDPGPGATNPQTPVEPAVSVVNSKAVEKDYHSSHKKWIILAVVVAAGAGIGLAMGGKKSSSSSPSATPATTGVSIGSPTVSVGQP